MNKKYIDGLSDETLAKMIDRTLLYKKTAKIRSITANLLKLIPAAAAVALVVGIINLSPFITKNIDIPSNDPILQTNYPGEAIELFLPTIVEKSFFEERIVAAIKDNKASNTINAYYSIRDPSAVNLPEYAANGIVMTFSVNRNAGNRFYVLNPDTSQKERERLLNILLEHTDLGGGDIIQMYKDSGVIITENPDPYAHVRFGATRDILLLDVEWHTPETYLAEVIEPYKELFAEWQKLNSELISEEYEAVYQKYLQQLENSLTRMREGKEYIARIINGKYGEFFTITNNYGVINMPYDSDGYYIYNVYPYYASVAYLDEDGVDKQKYFYWSDGINLINSKAEYDRILINEIIPFCEDLLARGLIPQEAYDYYTIPDPLEYCVNRFFN